MDWLPKFLTVPGLLVILLFAGCAGEVVEEAAPEPQRRLYEWYPEGLRGETRVEIDLSRQVALVTIGGERAGWTVVTTGKEGYGTPAGNFKITEKVVDKRSNLYGWIVDSNGDVINGDADTRKHKAPPGGEFVLAPMPYWMRLTSTGIGMHAGHIPRPGEAASHGCIRLPEDFAPLLFDRVKVGTPVRIVK